MESSKLPSVEARITAYVVLSGIMGASGGLMFGYNIGVSGGVTSMDSFLDKFFPTVSARKAKALENNYCKFNDQSLEAFTSSLYISGLVSTFIASWTSAKFGRKPTMFIAGLLFIVGVVLTSAGQNLAMLIVGRIILGGGTGFANQVGPMYLSEIAPANLRGGLNALFQLNITIGILVASLVNYGTAKIEPWGWRLSFGLAGIPAALLTLGSLVIVETPNSLVERGHLEKGKAILRKIRGVQNVDSEFEDLVRASEAALQVKRPYRSMVKRKNWPQLIISVLMQIFQQFTGINAIMFYAPAIFQAVGFKSGASLYAASILGAVNVLATAISVFTVDRFGRRVLLLEAGVQMLVSHVMIAILLGTGLKGGKELSHVSAVVVILMACAFVSAFAWSWGPMGWLIPSEIFPLESRSAGLSVAVFVNLLMTFAIAQAFLSMLCVLRFAIFLFFGAWVLLMTIFVLLFIPETKNIPLDATVHLWREHWFWKRLVDGGPSPQAPSPLHAVEDNHHHNSNNKKGVASMTEIVTMDRNNHRSN